MHPQKSCSFRQWRWGCSPKRSPAERHARRSPASMPRTPHEDHAQPARFAYKTGVAATEGHGQRAARTVRARSWHLAPPSRVHRDRRSARPADRHVALLPDRNPSLGPSSLSTQVRPELSLPDRAGTASARDAGNTELLPAAVVHVRCRGAGGAWRPRLRSVDRQWPPPSTVLVQTSVRAWVRSTGGGREISSRVTDHLAVG